MPDGGLAHSPREADRASLAAFVDALFRYADEGTHVSLRAFYDDREGVLGIRPVRLGSDLEPLTREAWRFASECAAGRAAAVFAPPVATFTNPDHAREADLANGLALSVECDRAPGAARQRLESLLGPATVVVASGGVWTDAETGEVQDKLHLHWRLTEATRDPASHAMLKRARTLAAALVGGDTTNQPMVHPIRWPGSWHRKSTPRLARIISLTEQEIELQDALDRLQEAAVAAGVGAAATTTGKAADAAGVLPGAEERDTAALVAEVLAGAEYHAPLVALAMRYLKGGMPDPQVVLTLRGIMQAVPLEARDLKDGTAQPGRWQARYDDIPRTVSTARAKLGAPAAPPVSDDLAELVNPAALQGTEPPAREWIVRDWLPVGCVTSLYGGAGFGKTLLAQQLQTATALGAPFLGLETAQCQSLAFYCEDDGDELHRRQRGICWHYGAQMSELGAMRWQGRFGKANVMATVENGLLKLTEFHDFVRRAVQATGARLVILDNIAQLFGGNENARPEVTQFVNALGAIAQEFSAAVLLLGHPGKATDSQFSGSTAWDAAVRSRWLLERPSAEVGDDGPAPAELADLRVLRKAKANYAGTGDEIPLRWVQGAFRVEGAGAVQTAVNLAEMTATNHADDLAFLVCLDALTGQGRNVSHNKFAANYAPKLMFGKPPVAGIPRKRLAAAMERLFDQGAIEVGVWGRGSDRKPIRGIVRRLPGEVRETSEEGAGDLREACGEPAGDLETGCGTPQGGCGKASANPLKSERDGPCGKPAGKCGKASANPLKSERGSCGGERPLYTTYIAGALGAAPAMDGDVPGAAA